MKQTLLDVLHKEQLEMALEVKRICEKNNIKYTMIAGTLLGAVRHQGFIPWDDDLDIGMLRRDYERFLKVARKELDRQYFLQTWDTDRNFVLPFAKIRKNGTKLVEQNSADVKMHQGIYIDIFAFDNLPRRPFDQKKQNWITWLLKRILLAKKGYTPWEKGELTKIFFYKTAFILGKFIPDALLKSVLYKQMTKYNGSEASWVVNFGGSYGYWKESIKKEWLENLVNLKFEEFELPGPKDYNDYLSYLYGDYMTPPPKSERENRHKISVVHFGE